MSNEFIDKFDPSKRMASQRLTQEAYEATNRIIAMNPESFSEGYHCRLVDLMREILSERDKRLREEHEWLLKQVAILSERITTPTIRPSREVLEAYEKAKIGEI